MTPNEKLLADQLYMIKFQLLEMITLQDFSVYALTDQQRNKLAKIFVTACDELASTDAILDQVGYYTDAPEPDQTEPKPATPSQI